jgi:hypothetical protein
MTDLREFRRACHEAARRTGGRIVEFRIADGVTPNFHQGVLDYGGHRLSNVCTRDRTEPVVAARVPPADLKYWAPADWARCSSTTGTDRSPRRPMTPWFSELFAENLRLMSDDWWPYGVSRNRSAVDTFLRYHYEQGPVQEAAHQRGHLRPGTARFVSTSTAALTGPAGSDRMQVQTPIVDA